MEVSQIKKPIGNLPLTLSKVFAGTIKPFKNLALNTSRNFSKFVAFIYLSLENVAKIQFGISL